MKYSIKKQMTLIVAALLLGTIAFCCIFSGLFLTRYQVWKKESVLVNAYHVLAELSAEENLTKDSVNEMISNQLQTDNLSLAVLTKDLQTIYMRTEDGLAQRLVNFYVYESGDLPSFVEMSVVKETSEYKIYEVKENNPVTASKNEMTYLEIVGETDQGDWILLRTSVESIKESAQTANEFLILTGTIGLLISVVVVWFTTKKFTEPILELVQISQRMTDLDFEAKYKSGGKNEIGLLGDHFNQMSHTLEKAISELKTANNELQKDIEEKMQIDEMRQDFVSNVSHELKTPIALIQGYAEGLKESVNDDEESREFYCDVIMDEASKMNKMVKKLLTLNRLEFGDEVIDMERFDITALIYGVLQSSDILINQKGVEIVFPQTSPVYVWGDEFKVEEVITNYISNALNHADYDKKVEIRLAKTDSRVRVLVFNTGDPIPEEDLDKIWVKFYKVDKARTRECGGDGIGLSIVKAIMGSLHQEYGVINYSNGVTFWFELDLAKECLQDSKQTD